MQLSELTKSVDVSLESLPWFLQDTAAALDAYRGDQYLVVDIETTNLDKGSALNENNRMVCAAWKWGDGPVEYSRGSEYEQHELVAALRLAIEDRVPIVAHAGKFEIQWFTRFGIDPHDFFLYDTMLGDYVLLGNRRQFRLDLGTVAQRWGYPTPKETIIDSQMKGGVCPSNMDPDLLRARVEKDVRMTEFVFLRQRDKLSEKGQLPILFTRCITTPCLADIEMQGLSLDADRVNEEYERAVREYHEANEKFLAFTGGINHKSPKQMQHYLYNVLKFDLPKKRNKPTKDWPDGAPGTDDKTLERLKARTKKQKKFLELRAKVGSLNAELTKTLQFFKGVLEERGGRFYGRIDQHVTKTHRTNSRGHPVEIAMFPMKNGKPSKKSVQFQNFPNKFKDLIRPNHEDWVQWEGDGSQLEFRVVVYLTQDPVGMADIRDDVDVHSITASVIYKIDLDKVDKKKHRTPAKRHTFKPVYAGRSGTKAEREYYDFFNKKYNVMHSVQTSWTYDVLKYKKLETPWGLRFYWPRTRMSQDGYIDNTPSIFNYPVQSLATAEIALIALVHLWHRIRANGLQAQITNTVHDSAVGECPKDEVEKVKQLNFHCFTMDCYNYLEDVYELDFNVPLGAGVTVGSRWQSPDSEEWELNVERDGDAWWAGSRRKT